MISHRFRIILLVVAGFVAAGCSTTGENTITIEELFSAEFEGQEPDRVVELRETCEDGELDACVELGELLASTPSPPEIARVGDGEDTEVPESARHTPEQTLRDECEEGVEPACAALAFLARAGFLGEPDLARARQLDEASCQRGYHDACVAMGYHHVIADEHEQALQQYREACDAGSPGGCVGLAMMNEGGLGVQPDRDRALELYRQACDEGLATGCTHAGRMLITTDESPSEARQLLDDACEQGAAMGCLALGMLQRRESDEGERTRELLETACELGNSQGCDQLGEIHADGIGVDGSGEARDADRAFEYSARSCNLGSATGCLSAAGFIYHGLTTEVTDHSRAAQLLAIGCGVGDGLRRGELLEAYDQVMATSTDCCMYLGTMVYEADGVERDLERVTRLYGRGCDRGRTDACVYYAPLLARDGTEEDRRRAEQLLEQACQEGLADGCFTLAVMLSDGELASPADPDRIQRLLHRSCELGSTQACQAPQQF